MYSDENNEKIINLKIKIFSFVTYFLLLVLLIRVAVIQILNKELFSEKSKKTREFLIKIQHPRGKIYSSDGKEIAGNKTIFNIVIDPKSLTLDYIERQKKMMMLSELLSINYEDLENIVKNAFQNKERILLVENIDFIMLKKFYELFSDVSGIEIEEKIIRYYPYGSFFSHGIGYIGPIDYDEFSKYKGRGYTRQDWIGKIGLESSYENYLKGKDGFISYEIDAKMNVNKNKILRKIDPVPGKTVITTIDFGLQKYAEEIMLQANCNGALMISNPTNGDILAMVSLPNFDPNIFVLQSEENINKKRELSLDTKGTPLINRNIQSEYPPGSTFKMVTGFAIVEENLVPLSRTYYCSGVYSLGVQQFKCWSVHGYENLYDAITNSCDVYFYNVSQIIGIDKITEYATKFGLGRITGIDLPYEKKGHIPSRIEKKQQGIEWYTGNTLNTVIGQGDVLMTNVQLLDYISVIGNRGYSYRPHLINKVIDPENNSIVYQYEPVINNKVEMKSETFDFIHRANINVTKNGTAAKVFYDLRKYDILGKTGTAEVGFGQKKQLHSLFVGYGPMNFPPEKRIAVSVILEFANNEYGKYAGYKASQIYRKWIELNNLEVK